MTSPLPVCGKKDQRAVVHFIWSESVPKAEINQRLSHTIRDSETRNQRQTLLVKSSLVILNCNQTTIELAPRSLNFSAILTCQGLSF
ncbi:hypothetical protein AVEN_83430-1 [Araneus ventricosus]|uniref:Uncharacterized protein n=1 Tax=Araneus ventricosus TaxID=182803 RepID=A0A4Y2PHV7_ARAVE|nr:hypothetical protein AVEN_83430-1 [Araneus ventricosus]